MMTLLKETAMNAPYSRDAWILHEEENGPGEEDQSTSTSGGG